jgi:hypothetical protein
MPFEIPEFVALDPATHCEFPNQSSLLDEKNLSSPTLAGGLSALLSSSSGYHSNVVAPPPQPLF